MESQASATGETFGQRFDHARPEVRPASSAEPASGLPIAMGLGGEAVLIGALYLLAAAAAAVGVVAGLVRLAEAAERGIQLADWLIVVTFLVGSVALAAGLAAVAQLLTVVSRTRGELASVRDSLAALGDRVSAMQGQSPDRQSLRMLETRLDKLGEQLDEVARNSLLDESGRLEKRRQVVSQQREGMVELIRREMADGQWDRARTALDRFRANFTMPADGDQANHLAEELDRRRDQAEAEDVAAVRRQCDELMSVSAWEAALEAATGLLAKHPESTPAKALLARVDRERKVAQEQQRQALYGQIQRHTSRREWREAVQAAHRLIDQFPSSIEAEAIRAQMETLSANAEIQVRQALEASIKDLVKRQRFEEAAALAQQVIDDYPDSPQASVLRGTIGQLREKAEQAAREARKRRVQW